MRDDSLMVNYGYNSVTAKWNENRKYDLAEELRKLLLELKLTRNTKLEEEEYTHDFPEPYVEVDGMYGGVRIRKITELTDEQQSKLIKKADEIYLKIMA